ncbi:N-acetylmuramoyl-L-alanine amidase [Geomonas paludis]|uniref:N-acetylmuramoyl-L-alanine amidase n=1 Tax=Geomonas paludis TaxID=2740185 RepID=A0A6V8MVA6_9BACT|nr:N-acetylmuramoyl-L-alanine amidase [Geomonas paludis]UPU38218.1 N-acetylmuramoyl-L-alanine amidase [Geomonas paludis]GFO63249.1 N-acetylmuramoyl-L-alanine amidase [Geomonas paludis]
MAPLTTFTTALLLVILGLSGCAAAQAPFSLVLDPGHTTAAPGALGCSGVYEKIDNDRLAQSIAAAVAADGTTTLRLTRTADGAPTLLDRVKGSETADLFLSVHHDSVQPGDGRIVAEKGRQGFCSSAASGFSIHVSRKNPAYEASLAFAEILGGKLTAAGFQPNLYHARKIEGENRPLLNPRLGIYAQDDLVVLKRTATPAVLLEAGVIVNPEDEAHITSPASRDAMARAVVEALGGFKLWQQKNR